MRTLRGWLVIGAIACVMAPAWSAAQGGGASPAPAAPAFTPVFRNVTRAEAWRFFEPRVSAGEPDYAFIANQLLVGFRQSGPWHEVAGAIQYVQFGGLPTDAIGPGPLGTGATYFDHNRSTDPGEVYVKALHILLRDRARGLSLRAGRMAYASAGEAPSGVPAIEGLKRLRLDARLVGEFEWSLFQRSFDGVRGDWAQPAFQLTGAALWPTQGGFEQDANQNLRDVRLLSGVITARPAAALPYTELQVFAYHYADERPVTGRPDNSGRLVSRADLSFTTVGGHAVSVFPSDAGRVDALGWVALQQGAWYESNQDAWAVALEGGFQWNDARWAPWLRVGWNRASGDDDPADERHGTFMPPLPTARKYAFSTAYTFMNVDDLFVQAIVRPLPDLTIRADVHRLRLAEASDLWYAGSGATRRRGAIFGYAGRRTEGADDLGTIVEGSADYTITRRWSVNAYLGHMHGGDVVRAAFTHRPLTFGYVENVIVF